jgi:hypothetical protein
MHTIRELPDESIDVAKKLSVSSEIAGSSRKKRSAAHLCSFLLSGA